MRYRQRCRWPPRVILIYHGIRVVKNCPFLFIFLYLLVFFLEGF
ncbi:hypothetical protein BMETH_3051_0 [methanotrophic bacterial endosymbiont of Bathymodiolus sp.]|nr:hypothetical protein BMETH_3051_0 [methanotrophic bacterial endosymbiont of Bathymodiolus sp.]